jgi:hypothetical protein
MDKSSSFTGQPLFNQLLSLIPKNLIAELCLSYQTDRYCKRFLGYDHLVTMLFACFNRCNSIREVITGMQANHHRLQHVGLENTPRRSTLSDANKRTAPEFFEALFHRLHDIHYGVFPDSLKKKKDEERLFIIDSTTISLFSDIMKGAGMYNAQGKKKGGAKAHVVMNAQQNVPCFVSLTEARQCDKSFLSQIKNLPKGSIVVMDKGYNVYKQYIKWTADEVTWITRLNGHSLYEVIDENEVTESQVSLGVRQDLIIYLGNPATVMKNPLQKVRLVKFYDEEKNRDFYFITNQLKGSPARIADFYKRRWQIEKFFARFKSNFPLNYFLGDTENAIKIQIWCSLIADLLVAVVRDRVKKLSKKVWSFANLASLIRQHLSTYIDLFKFLSNPDNSLITYKPPDPSIQFELFHVRGVAF